MRSEVALVILYDNDSRVLLQHRTDDAEILPGYWAFFGGGIKEGEAPDAAVRRETFEELAWRLNNHELFLEQDYTLPNTKGHMYLFLAPFQGKKSSLSLNEGQGWGWFNQDEVDELKMMEHDRDAVRAVIKHLDEQNRIFLRIEDACNLNDQELIKAILSSINSAILKKSSFQKVIDCYENKGIFPVGYCLMFVQWLICNHDFDHAMKCIRGCIKRGVSEERISRLIFDNLIKPDEYTFRERFRNNLTLLIESKVLFGDLEIDFEKAKHELTVIAGDDNSFPESLMEQKDKKILIADLINTGDIIKVLEKGNFVYFVLDDIKKLYYLLFFEDISILRENIERKRLLFFPGKDKSALERFFSNNFVMPPDYYYDISKNNQFRNIIRSVFKFKEEIIKDALTELNTHYEKYNQQYYQKLFLKDPADIKILLATSKSTELNKYITENWHRAFLKLGYQVNLLIENEPFEILNRSFMINEINKYKPDIVFQINHPISSLFSDVTIINNLLWIMRYRDLTDIGTNECRNMFISSMVREWADDLAVSGIDEDRILYSADGVDLNIFCKKETENERYQCDIVSVNNSGGDEFFRLIYLLEGFKDINIKQIIHEIFADINEMGNQEQFIFFDNSFLKLLDNKFYQKGLQLLMEPKKAIVRFFTLMMFAFYRRKIVEWILDSGITKNLKVWGRGWSNYEKFKDYHMGMASHGEELATIYSNSKISISDHPNIPLHERNFEILSCGGFPLVKYIKPENDENIDYINNYFKENEEMVLFYDKEDLLNKVQFYLDNPEERERIAANGRKVVVREFSNIAVARNTMDFIKKYYGNVSPVSTNK